MIKEKTVKVKIEYNDISTDIDELTKHGNVVHEDHKIRVTFK